MHCSLLHRFAAPCLALLLIACRADPSPIYEPATATAARSADTPTPTLTSPTPTDTPTPTTTRTPTITPTPHPLVEFTLEGMRARSYPGGEIHVLGVVSGTEEFTTYTISYPSDGLTITGRMTIPAGDGPFPVIILNHAYWPRDLYFAGADVQEAAEYLAARGYLALSPDYRSWGESDGGLSLFHMGLVADVLNLVSSADSIPQADPSRIGMWGHSMGGGITIKALVIDPRIQAGVVYAPNSADDADLFERWGPGCLPGQTDADFCDPAEVIPAGTPQALLDLYFAAAADPAQLEAISPYYHLDLISAPVQIHIGLEDGRLLNATPPEWSRKLYDGLLAAGKDATYYTYPQQGHFFDTAAWPLFMARAVEFYDTHVKQ